MIKKDCLCTKEVQLTIAAATGKGSTDFINWKIWGGQKQSGFDPDKVVPIMQRMMSHSFVSRNSTNRGRAFPGAKDCKEQQENPSKTLRESLSQTERVTERGFNCERWSHWTGILPVLFDFYIKCSELQALLEALEEERKEKLTPYSNPESKKLPLRGKKFTKLNFPRACTPSLPFYTNENYSKKRRRNFQCHVERKIPGWELQIAPV